MLQHVYNLREDMNTDHYECIEPRLKFVITRINLNIQHEDFGYMKYGYKKYHEQDYYLEATTLSGEKVDIDGNGDIDWLIDPLNGPPAKIDTSVDTLYVNVYHFNAGEYKIRWVYDPDNNSPGFKNDADKHQPPIYSNWETIEVIR